VTPALPRKRMVGYADRISVAPGETIRFMASCEGVARYRAALVRILSGDRHPQGTPFAEEVVPSAADGTYAGRLQVVRAGSFAHVDGAPFAGLRSFTLQAMLWPTAPGRGRQVVMGCRDEAAGTGYALVLDAAGAAALEIGGRSISAGVPLLERAWAFVAATYDAATGRARVVYESQAVYPGMALKGEAEAALPPPAPAAAPFTLAAAFAGTEHGRPLGAAFFNGKIDIPRVADTALDRAAMETLRRPAPAPARHLVAAWDFARAMGTDRIEDAGPHRRHGRLVNLPTRAMKGHNWTGETFAWPQAPEQYGAIHFHDDDVYDAGWLPDLSLALPDDLPSGAYALRMTAEDDGEVERIPFFVRPPRGRATAEVAFLAPTASYMAYANERAGIDGGGYLHAFANHLLAYGPEDLWLNAHAEVGLSHYDHHSDGSGVAYSSRLRPILNLRPGVTNCWIGAAGTAPWQYNADLPLLDWARQQGIACDVITDEDLHHEGLALLAPYKAIMTGSHPEYWSKAMYDALQAYLARGGRLMYLGGNGFYWRVAFHPELPGVIELRRTEDGIRDWVAEGGEYYHAFTGEYGGMWSRMGRPIHALAGIGMAAQGFDVSSYYRRTAASHDPAHAWVFEGVAGDIVGDFGTVGGGAAGLEVDRYDPAQGSPPHAVVLASSEMHSDTYFPPPDEVHNMSALLDGRQNPRVRADMVLFPTPNGGAVFSVGSISWIGSLTWNGCANSVSRVTANVLRRFLDPRPLVED